MGIDPYDAKTKPNAITSDRPYAGCSRFLGVGETENAAIFRLTRVIFNTICRGEIETQCNNVRPPPRGGIPVWAVGWVDVGIDPYGAKSKPCTIMPIRPYGAESQFRGFANRQPIRSERVRQGPDALFCVIF